MDEINTSLLLKRPVNLKVIVTARWKEEMQQQLQSQINQLNNQIQQIEMQEKRAVAELQKQNISSSSPQINQQIDNVSLQANHKKSEILEQKNQFLQQIQQVQVVELDQEVVQGQIENFFQVKKGDNLVQKLNIEIVIRDGVIEEIRGDI